MAKSPLISFDRDVHWTNKHLNLRATPDRLYDVMNRWSDGTRPPAASRFRAGLAALRRIVRDAEAANKRVRCLGGGWSLSSIATTEDFMVNTKLLNYINIGFKPANVSRSFSGQRERLVFVQTGTSVQELNQALEPRGLSLPTSGASNGQTICGAISTGTHGSNRRIGAMQDFILGLHVVAEGGKTYWIERRSRPVVSQAFCRVIGATLKRDDNLFKAAVVGIGSFGLVHAVAFEAVPIFTLESYGRRFDVRQLRSAITTLDVSSLRLPRGDRTPDHFEVIINPFATAAGKKGAFLRFKYQLPSAPQPAGLSGGSSFAQGADVLTLLGHVSNVVPGIIPAVAEEAFDQLKEGGPTQRSLGDTFGPTGTLGFVMSTEIGVAQSNAEDAVDAIVSVANTFPWAGLVALRYVKRSDAFMAFTRFAPTTCTIELPSAGSARSAEAFERIWDELEARNIPYTLHWGQMLRYDPQRVKAAFGARADQWGRARRAFLGATGRRLFSNALLETAGLSG